MAEKRIPLAQRPITRERAEKFHQSRSDYARWLDNTQQAKIQYPEPNEKWLSGQYNRSDVVGIDDIYTPVKYTQRGKVAKRQPKKKIKKFEKLRREVLKDNFTPYERKLLRHYQYRFAHINAAGQHNAFSKTITMDEGFLGKGKEKAFKEILTHEMVHGLRATDPKRPDHLTRNRTYVIGADSDYEESQTEFETVARVKQYDREARGYGYYTDIEEPPYPDNKHQDRKLAIQHTHTGGKQKKGYYALKTVEKRWPDSNIAHLRLSGKVELVDTYWLIKKNGKKNSVHITYRGKISNDHMAKAARERLASDLARQEGVESVYQIRDGKPVHMSGKRMKLPTVKNRPTLAGKGPGRGWHRERLRHREAALKGRRRR